MEQVSPIKPVNPILNRYLARIGAKAAIGAPDDKSAKLWSDTAIEDALHGVEQAATDYAAIQVAKADIAVHSPLE